MVELQLPDFFIASLQREQVAEAHFTGDNVGCWIAVTHGHDQRSAPYLGRYVITRIYHDP